MFKVDGFNLPEIKTDTASSKKNDNKASSKHKSLPPTGDDLQSLFSELGRTQAAVEDSEPKTKGKQKQKEKQKSHNSNARTDENSSKQGLDTDKRGKKRAAESRDANKSSNTRPEAAPTSKKLKLTPMQLKMQAKLSGARFRWINEQLYTTSSDNALTLFNAQPELFEEYHKGFRHQVESWPENPVNSLVNSFKDRLARPLNAPGGLPANPKTGEIVIADMGCGEAELASQVSKLKGSRKSRRANFKIHSFDLHKANDRITVADISNVPLPDASCDIVVFCLALMGTNLEDFLREAKRILKPRGEIWVAEIKSRFDNGNSYDRFVKLLKSLGLHHKATDDSNTMFVKFEFQYLPGTSSSNKPVKFIEPETAKSQPILKPCIYKRR